VEAWGRGEGRGKVSRAVVDEVKAVVGRRGGDRLEGVVRVATAAVVADVVADVADVAAVIIADVDDAIKVDGSRIMCHTRVGIDATTVARGAV